MFEIASRIGYERSILPYLNIGLTYNKYNLAFEDVYNDGFTSFDLNLEYMLIPYHRFSPLLLAGGGYNAPNTLRRPQPNFRQVEVLKLWLPKKWV